MEPILGALGVGSTMQYSKEHSYVIFGLIFIFVFEELASAIFRSEGDIRRSTIAIAISAIINIILDPLLIYVFNLGIAGAAWATVLSSAIASLVMCYWIWSKKDLYLDLSLKNFNFQPDLIWDNLQVALPSTFETLIFSALAIIINVLLVMAGGFSAVGSYTAAMRIVQFATLPIIAIGTAVLTVAGVAYGAKNVKNLNMTLSYSIKISFAISIAVVILILLFSPQIASLFAYLFCFIFGWGLNGIYAGIVFGSFIGGLFGYIGAKYFIKKFNEKIEKNNVETS